MQTTFQHLVITMITTSDCTFMSRLNYLFVLTEGHLAFVFLIVFGNVKKSRNSVANFVNSLILIKFLFLLCCSAVLR